MVERLLPPLFRLFTLCALGCGPLQALSPPPDSASKVERVLLYNKIGGWYCDECRQKVQGVFFDLARAKGFQVDTTSSIADLTLENLKRYQAIVWNNNTDGAASVPDTAARAAVEAYVRQGGGWMLVNLANYHYGSWSFLTGLLGQDPAGWSGGSVPGVLVADSAARSHPELRFIVMALPDTIPLTTNWFRIRPPNAPAVPIHSLYTLRNVAWNPGQPPVDYGSYYIRASALERGRALSIPLGWHGGFAGYTIMAQGDGVVPKLYWQGLRWLAGDFQGGCTDPAQPGFDPDARVDDGSCASVAIRRADSRAPARSPVRFRVRGRRVVPSAPIPGARDVRLRDVRGRTVWTRAAPGTLAALDLPGDLPPGLYALEIAAAGASFRARLLLP